MKYNDAMTAVINELHNHYCEPKEVRPDSWLAKCPAHNDGKPSLSIDRGKQVDGVLLKCWAGCGASEIVAALGLSLGDLFDQVEDNPGDRRAIRKAFPAAKVIRHFRQEQRIILMAAADIRAGRPLSDEDTARVKLAHARLEQAYEELQL